jgi:hypothetical protein
MALTKSCKIVGVDNLHVYYPSLAVWILADALDTKSVLCSRNVLGKMENDYALI